MVYAVLPIALLVLRGKIMRSFEPAADQAAEDVDRKHVPHAGGGSGGFGPENAGILQREALKFRF